MAILCDNAFMRGISASGYTLINNTTDAPAANYSSNLGVWLGDTTYYTNLVDEDINTSYHSSSQGQTGYIQFQVSTGSAAVKCEMYFNTNIIVNQYTQFLFQGSNNGSSWTTLYTDNAPPTTAGEYTASWSNTTTYTYYRWTATWGYTSYYLNSISEMRWYAE